MIKMKMMDGGADDKSPGDFDRNQNCSHGLMMILVWNRAGRTFLLSGEWTRSDAEKMVWLATIKHGVSTTCGAVDMSNFDTVQRWHD